MEAMCSEVMISGAFGGFAFGTIGHVYGSDWGLSRVALHGIAGGGVAEMSGGDFRDGFMFAGITAASRYMYNKFVPYDATWEKGCAAVEKSRNDSPIEGANNIGVQGRGIDPNGWRNEGGRISRFMNNIPGINAVAGLHDVFQINLGSFAGTVLCYPSMLPLAVPTYAGLMADNLSYSIYMERMKRSRIR